MTSKRPLRAAAVDGIAIDHDPADPRMSAGKRATRRGGAAAKGHFLNPENILGTARPSAVVSDGLAVPEISPGMLATADAKLVEPSAPRVGSLDTVDYRHIAGWVWDPARPDEAVDIEILDDDNVVLKVCASSFRRDLQTAGFGNGYHGFDLQNVEGVFTLSRHRVRVRRASDGQDLSGSPCWITRPGLDRPAMDFMERAIYSAVAASATADEIAQPLSHLLRLLNDLINAYAALARTHGDGQLSSAAEIAAELGLTGRTRDLVDQLLSEHPHIHFEPAAEPLVSVVIPVHGKFSFTYNCLKSIQQALPKRPFEIIIVDDCSDDETLLAALVFSGGVRILRNPSNLGFVRSCNVGAAEANGKYLFFLNNDTLVQEGWLDELVETFEQVPNVGIAGSKLLFENGQLQEAGGIVWRLGDAWNWGRGRDPNDPAFCFLRDADYVSGAALMIERKLFKDLRGFDERYVPAYYEDTDLAFRVRATGKRVVVQPASQLVHLEGITSGTDTGAGMKRYQVINHGKFYQRWKDTLITHRFNGEQAEQEAERLVRRRAYFIDDSVPTPDQDAGSNAAVAHMRALMELGYKVVFLPADNMSKIHPYTAQLEKLGIECRYHPFYWSVEEVFRKSGNRPDLVYLHRHSNATKYATMVRRYFPDCRIVYSVCDLHFLRLERQAQIERSAESAAQAAAQRRSELAVMQCVDCVIVYSPYEARMLQDCDPSLNVTVVPWTVAPQPFVRPFADRAGTAFVGGFSHPPNVDAVRHLVSDILPLLRARVPDCTTYIVGSRMPQELADLRAPGLVPLGFVPALADILHQLRCTVVPLRYGAGVKGKVLDSFAHGLPCVMSEVAAEGLDLPEDLAWLVARTPEEFADKLERVHTDAEFNQLLSEAGLAYINARYSPAAVNAALADAVAPRPVDPE